jgi:hypothetical protein
VRGAFEHKLGVQVSVGFWDPAGFVTDGSIGSLARRRQTETYRALCETFQDQSSRTAASKGDFGFKARIPSDLAAETAKLGAEIAKGRLAMRAFTSMVSQNALFGSAWGDWFLRIGFSVRTFAHELGV